MAPATTTTTTIRQVTPKEASNAADLKSVDFFIPHMLCWKLLGISSDPMPLAPLFFVYGVFVNIAVTLCYPLHVCWSMFSYATLGENLMNLTLCVTCVSCSLKFVLFVANRKKLREIDAILSELDARIQSPPEVRYCETIRRNAKYVANLFFSVYISVAITAELSFLTRGERSLLYPAYFPLDWKNSTRNFYIANVYQFVGIFFQITQNYANDSLPAMALCLLSSHIKLLGIRVSSIGWSNESPEENEKELLACIKDQKNLYLLYEKIQEFLSIPMFFQVVTTGVTTCLAMIIWMFFTTSPFDRLYYFVYFLSMPMEIFPTCYYGSDVQILFSQLHEEIFASNWTGQSRSFKRNMLLFTERSLKETTVIAGRMVRVHLNTFFSTCKGAYSLYAVINSMKKVADMSGYQGYKQTNDFVIEQGGHRSRHVGHKAAGLQYSRLESIMESGDDLLRAAQANWRTQASRTSCLNEQESSVFLDAKESVLGVQLHNAEAHTNLLCHFENADSRSQTRLHLYSNNSEVWYSAVSVDDPVGRRALESHEEADGDHSYYE